VNAWRTPGRILGNHTKDKGANVFTDTLPSAYSSDSGDPCPIQTKPRPVPVHDGSRTDQNKRCSPSGPECPQRNPEQLVQRSQLAPRSLRVKCQQLPTQCQVLEDEILPGTKSTDYPAEEMSEPRDHGMNLTAKVRLELCLKSFIVRMYEVLARHSQSAGYRDSAPALYRCIAGRRRL
jgi:hypothetical protein